MAQYIKHEQTAATKLLKSEFDVAGKKTNVLPLVPVHGPAQDLGDPSGLAGFEKSDIQGTMSRLKASMKQLNPSRMKSAVATSKTFAQKLSKHGKELEAAEVLAEVMLVEQKISKANHKAAHSQSTHLASVRKSAEHNTAPSNPKAASADTNSIHAAMQNTGTIKVGVHQVTDSAAHLHPKTKVSTHTAESIPDVQQQPKAGLHPGSAKAPPTAQSSKMRQDFFQKEAANEQRLIDVGHAHLGSNGLGSKSAQELQSAVVNYVKSSEGNAIELIKQELVQGIDQLKVAVKPIA
jgi:hypothetical protein